jgi:hypothetical protein
MTLLLDAPRFAPVLGRENGRQRSRTADQFRVFHPPIKIREDLRSHDRVVRQREASHPTRKTRADLPRDPGDPTYMVRELEIGFRNTGERFPSQLAMDVAGVLTLVNVREGQRPREKGQKVPTPTEQELEKVTAICADPDGYHEIHEKVTQLLDRTPGQPWKPLATVVEANLVLAKEIAAEIGNVVLPPTINESGEMSAPSTLIYPLRVQDLSRPSPHRRFRRR